LKNGDMTCLSKEELKGKRMEKDSSLFNSKKLEGTLEKFNYLIKPRKTKQTVDMVLHRLNLAVHDLSTGLALDILEELNFNQCIKKHHHELNRIFLKAMMNRLEPVTLLMFQKGFPLHVNRSIYTLPKSSKFQFPSYFLIAISLNLGNLAKAMIKRAYVNQSWFGITPLILASIQNQVGNVPLVKMLLDHGADPNLGIPLHLLKHLIDLNRFHGSKNQPCDSFISPKFTFASNLSSDGSSWTSETSATITLEKFVYQKGSPKSSLLDGSLPLKKTLIYPLDLACACVNLEIVHLLLPKMKPSVLQTNSFSLLLQQDVPITLALLKHSINLNQMDSNGNTPLHLAARLGNLDLVLIYLWLGFNVNQPGENGWTPLHEAFSYGHQQISRYLLSAGARLTLVNAKNQTPKHLARLNGIFQDELKDYEENLVLTDSEKSQQFYIILKAHHFLTNQSPKDMPFFSSEDNLTHLNPTQLTLPKPPLEILNKSFQHLTSVSSKDKFRKSFDSIKPFRSLGHKHSRSAFRIPSSPLILTKSKLSDSPTSSRNQSGVSLRRWPSLDQFLKSSTLKS